MTGPQGLSDFQIAVSQVFFTLDASRDYVVAGGAALLASDLITRPTQDLDLFAASPVTSVAAAKEQLVTEASKLGWTVSVIRDQPTFCRLVISGDDEVLVDLALDSPPATAPQLTILGPTLAPLELAGRKMLALFGRAEIRDFADVHALAQRFGKEALLAEAAAADPGFDVGVLAQMFRSLDRFDDDAFPTAPDQVAPIRAFFDRWTDELR